jgi:UDP-N-acetylglucosamine 2-epimerase (non-hydrolysing)
VKRIQEKTAILDVPCLAPRENTERQVTVTQGTNRIVGNDPERVVKETVAVLDGKGESGHTLELWDGQAAEWVVAVLHSWCRWRETNETQRFTAKDHH